MQGIKKLHLLEPEFKILNEADCSSAVLAFCKMMRQTAGVLDKLKVAIAKAIDGLERAWGHEKEINEKKCIM